MKKAVLFMGLFLVFFSHGFFAGAGEFTEAVSKGYVTPQWLKAHADDPGLIIVDVSFKKSHYDKEHISGAVFLDWVSDLADPKEKKYYRVVPQEGFEKAMSRIGANPESLLVFYDNRQNRMAIRGLWVSAYYGHDRAVVLEGGIPAWRDAGFEISTEPPRTRPTAYKAKAVHKEMDVDKSFVFQNLKNPSVTFVDSRPREMFTGEAPGSIVHTGEKVARRGHIPGAVNLPWKLNIDRDSRFLSAKTLEDLYRSAGLAKDKLLVFYCNEGLHAIFNWFVATKMLGYEKVKVYEGSMGEWADDPMLPMVSGVGF